MSQERFSQWLFVVHTTRSENDHHFLQRHFTRLLSLFLQRDSKDNTKSISYGILTNNGERENDKRQRYSLLVSFRPQKKRDRKNHHQIPQKGWQTNKCHRLICSLEEKEHKGANIYTQRIMGLETKGKTEKMCDSCCLEFSGHKNSETEIAFKLISLKRNGRDAHSFALPVEWERDNRNLCQTVDMFPSCQSNEWPERTIVSLLLFIQDTKSQKSLGEDSTKREKVVDRYRLDCLQWNWVSCQLSEEEEEGK